MPADLHLHTAFSDGTFTPEELVARARQQRLTALSLTDHDTAEGCPRTAAACREAGLTFLPGTELTTEIAGTELHLLGYGFSLQNRPLQAAMARFQQARQDRIREMVERLNQHRIPLQSEAVFALASCRSPGRPHVARALVAGGWCSGVDEAFTRFLRKGRPAWVPKAKLDIADAIQLLHQAGGAAVLAHPGISHADPYIPVLLAAGLDGIECYHSRHSAATADRYLQMAREHQLLITGGSDCHGMAKGQPLIGSVRLDDSHFDLLRQTIDRYRTAADATPQPHR